MAHRPTTRSLSVSLNASAPLAKASSSSCLDIALGLDMVGDEPSLHELLDLAEKSLARDIPAIAAHLAAGDAKAANQLLHSTKGFVPIFCSAALVQQVTRVELLSKSANAAEIASAYAELAPALSQLLDEIRQFLKTVSPRSGDDEAT